MIIREEGPADHAAIHAVVAAAFDRSAEADLVDQLRADRDSVLSLCADEHGAIIGHVMFSAMTAPFRALGLGPVAVLPGRQRAGIGDRLIRAGIERATSDGWQGVFVLGDPAYYRRFGFDPDLAKDFASPYAGPYLMALPLAPALPQTQGRIDYAPAFGRLAD